MAEKKFKVVDVGGIHARPAMALVKLASKFVADIHLEFNETIVNLKSIMGVMSLGIPFGSELIIIADGADEDEAIVAISQAMDMIGLAEVP